MVIINFLLEILPGYCVFLRVTLWYPYAKDIIDVMVVEEEEDGLVFCEYLAFVDCKEEVGVGGVWWGAHSGSGKLQSERVAKVEHVVLYDEHKGFGEGGDGYSGESVFLLVDILGYLPDGGGGVDVRVHQRGVGGEEAPAGQE